MALVHVVVLGGAEDAAECGFHTEHREVVARHHLRHHPLGLLVHAERGRHQPAAQDIGQRLGLPLQVLVERIRVHPGPQVAAHVRPLLVQHHELFRGFHGELAQQELVDQREDRGVGPNPESQREDRNGREQGVAAEAPERSRRSYMMVAIAPLTGQGGGRVRETSRCSNSAAAARDLREPPRLRMLVGRRLDSLLERRGGN